MLTSLQYFCKKRETYEKIFHDFLRQNVLSHVDIEKILNLLSKLLMNPEYTRDVAECFPHVLLALIIIAIPLKDQCAKKSKNPDSIHRLNCTILGILIPLHPDVLGFTLEYFHGNPAPFEALTETFYVPTKKQKIETEELLEISDNDFVQSCYNILKAAPHDFIYKWNWSKFYKYLLHKDDQVKWVALKCVRILLEMSELLFTSSANSLLNNVNKFFFEIEKYQMLSTYTTNIESIKTNEITGSVSSVASIGGVLLPVFKENFHESFANLVRVPSTEQNLFSVALAIAARKCVCLQGFVGCGKTAIVEYLAKITGHGQSDFIKVQLGDQMDSKMLLGTYRCTDIPGEFVWQPGVLTQAVIEGKWLLLEDIDSASSDILSVLSNLMEMGTLIVPGHISDTIRVKNGFQLFVTQRLIYSPLGSHKEVVQATNLLEKHWLCVNIQTLSRDELIHVVQTQFPMLSTIASRVVDVFLVFFMGIDRTAFEDQAAVLQTRQSLTSMRDLMKWCSRANDNFVVSSVESGMKLLQDAIDIFCCSVPDQSVRLKFATMISNILGITKEKAEYFCTTYKPAVNLDAKFFVAGQGKLRRRKPQNVRAESTKSKFSFTRLSVCLLEQITVCVMQKEPVLLVGETGTGKTSSIQYLAQSTGNKLIVINMNQQSESADLLGGYKPVDLKFLIMPIRETFDILFRRYFAVGPNKKFLEHVAACFKKGKWKSLVTLMSHSTAAAIKRLKSEIAENDCDNKSDMLAKWLILSEKLEKLMSQVNAEHSLAFAFIEGSLIEALKEGYWVLLDEINLATAETLQCLSGLLEGSAGSVSLLERGDKQYIKRHSNFTIFACMNPATDVGKKDLPVGIRNRFTEFYVDELTNRCDLQILVASYLETLHLPAQKQDVIVKFYLSVRKEASTTLLDGTAHKPHYSLRTLCRALSIVSANPCGTVLRSIYEAFCMSFLTQLENKSYKIVHDMIVTIIFKNAGNLKSICGAPIPKPKVTEGKDFIECEGYWIVRGSMTPETPQNYILTESVKRNLKDLVRIVSIGKMPVLLQGNTSVGKTSLITYLAKIAGHVCLRINNHEHTDLQEYIGNYVADESGNLVFREGILVEAMRKGYWIILDELNLAPSEVLEALNRVLDDNRELFIPEIQRTVKAHENFMLFATQNPPGLYGGRKVLSRAFRNRFIELHFNEIPACELQIILHKRCSMPESYCKQVINVMIDLQIRRKNTDAFAGKYGFITLRDLFRWGERYRLAPNHKNLYDWSQHLADEGYLVLAAKVRRPEEAEVIREIIKKHLKRDVNPENLFSLNEKTSSVTRHILEDILIKKKVCGFDHIVWTYQTRRIAVLSIKALQFKEPVLLVGETGGGKTTITQLIARSWSKELYIVNCHMQTESSDFLGNLRPVRNHTEDGKLFEWVDGPLIKAMINGDIFLADEISLADDSVLERLNSLLEPERTLLLTEKGINVNDSNETITAHNDFCFMGTMNPGGDYGKKELSPALRNRFTEIWCESSIERNDLRSIIKHNLVEKLADKKDDIADSILEFVEWFTKSDVGRRLIVSIRDVMSWVNFLNICTSSNMFKLTTGEVYLHGALLTYIDSLGIGLTSTESPGKLATFREDAMKLLEKQKDRLHDGPLEDTLVFKNDMMFKDDMIGIAPFFIKKGSNVITEDLIFTFQTPTTASNALKLLRALQLTKPILLEGSPGVGKTSLVSALAKASGHTIVRINLSDQTDISDLFGADLPVEDGNGGEFEWKDGPFLQALNAGHWILLDELNLASQSVLEGLNACFDHRGEIFIPELGKIFAVKPGTKLFACQNPLKQGGARKGLPKSFLNRFTQVSIDALTDDDIKLVAGSLFSELPIDLIYRMVDFNSTLAKEAGFLWGHRGAPWEMNLRDIVRWCEATIKMKVDCREEFYNPGGLMKLIYAERMRTEEDKSKVCELYGNAFSIKEYPLLPAYTLHMTDENVYFGDIVLKRTNSSFYNSSDLLILRSQASTLQSLALCVKMNWMAIVVGESGCGKSCAIRVLAQLTGQTLKSICVNSTVDTTEILGGFEQTDYNRHLECLLNKTETLLIDYLKTEVTKESISHVTRYHALLEQSRKIEQVHGNRVNESIAQEIFLKKIHRLTNLVQELKADEPLLLEKCNDIEEELTKLADFVRKDKCLNAGGKFEWVDSVLVKCLREGHWLVIDHVNLCSPAVLDRLNGLLEPNGVLSIGERGVDKDGKVVTVKPHPNFRLFLTMNPKYGEISRAMRNRGVEICMLNNTDLDSMSLDLRSLVFHTGLTRKSHQDALLDVHEKISQLPVNLNQLNVIYLVHSAFLIVQQLSRGLHLVQAFRTACVEVYLKGRLITHQETKQMIMTIIDEAIANRDIVRDEDSFCDFDAATLNVNNLQKNSKLTVIRNQGFLINWAVRAYSDHLRKNTNSTLTTTFLNNFFARSIEESTTVERILPFMLLHFYEVSTRTDAEIRKGWLLETLKDTRLESLKDTSSELAEEVKRYADDPNNSNRSRAESASANKLALLLYFKAIINSNEATARWSIEKGEKRITVAQYSNALREGKLTKQVIDQPLVENYVVIITHLKKCIDTILHDKSVLLTADNYTHLRVNLKWLTRFCKLGDIVLIDQQESFGNLDEVSLLLVVHYKWLKKFVQHFIDVCGANSLSDICKTEVSFLSLMMESIDRQLKLFSDAFVKMLNRIKKRFNLHQPNTSEKLLTVSGILKSASNSFLMIPNNLRGDQLDIDNQKLILMQTEEAHKVKSQLVSLLEQVYVHEFIHESAEEDLSNIQAFCENRLCIREPSTRQCPPSLGKEMMNSYFKMQMWPIHEFFFFVFANRIQRELCENIDFASISSYLHSNLLNIASIPIELFAILKAIANEFMKPEKKSRMLCSLFLKLDQFNHKSFEIIDVVELFKEEKSINRENFNRYSMKKENLQYPKNSVSGPVLVNLIIDLLFNKNNSFLTEITLQNFDVCIRQMKILNELMWKNSVALNSEEFDYALNDLRTLHSLIKCFLSACETEDHRIDGEMSTKEKEFYLRLEELRNCSNALPKASMSANERGKLWVLLGYLQVFIFGNVGYIDPIQKLKLKLKYIDDDLEDLKSSTHFFDLQSRYCGYSIQNDRLSSIRDRVGDLLVKQQNFDKNMKIIRPGNSEFIALSNEFLQFIDTIGSYKIISDHVSHLTVASKTIEENASKSNIDAAKISVREIETWKESIEKFLDYTERRYLTDYPDIVFPFLIGLAQVKHGMCILSDDLKKHIALAEINLTSRNAENTIYNLLRFPTIGVRQGTLLNLTHLCIARNTREILNQDIETSDSIEKQFRLTMSALKEFYNYVLINGEFSKSLWIELNAILQQVVLIWKKQQADLELREQEENIYKNQVRTFGDSLTEEEEISLEIQTLFAAHGDDDFSDMTESVDGTKKIDATKKDLSTLLTEQDVELVNEIHSKIVRTFTSSEWLTKQSCRDKPEYIEPLLQRYGMFARIIKNVNSALEVELSTKLHVSLNVLTYSAIQTGSGVRQDKPYDFYTDSNVKEVKACIPLLDKISESVQKLLEKWEDHPTLLSLEIILQRIYSFPNTSSVSRFLTGLEILLAKVYEWEKNAHSAVSLLECSVALTKQIISWRKLELSCWQNYLNKVASKSTMHTSKWWFYLYALFESYVNKNVAENLETSESITADKLIETLKNFMCESTLGEFEARLHLLLTFHCHMYYLDSSPEKDELISISWNIYHYYQQFVASVRKQIARLRAPIEKKLKDFVKIARWNDISYWAVKESIDKTRRTLYKYIKEFENVLKNGVLPCLSLEISEKEGIWDRPVEKVYTVEPNDFALSARLFSSPLITVESCDIVSTVDNLFTKADKFCKKVIQAALYAKVHNSVKEVIEEITDHVTHLKKLEVDRTLPANKQKSNAKSILQQKRLALSDYFQTLLQMGISYRLGIMTMKHRQDEVFDYKIAPINIAAAFEGHRGEKVECNMINMWKDCDAPYYQALIKLQNLENTLISKKSDLSVKDLERFKGCSVHIMLIASKQKRSLATLLQSFIPLQMQVSALSRIQVDDVALPKQKDLHLATSNLKELLILLQTTLEQFAIYVQSCPDESDLDCYNEVYNLTGNDSSILNARKGDEIWQKGCALIDECLNRVVNISKQLASKFSKFHTSIDDRMGAPVFTPEHFKFLREIYESLAAMKEPIQTFETLFEISTKSKHPLVLSLNFVKDQISKYTNAFTEILTFDKSLVPICQGEVKSFERNLEALMKSILIVVQTVYREKKERSEAKEKEETDNDDNKETINLKDELDEPINAHIKMLKLAEVSRDTTKLLKSLYDLDPTSAAYCFRLLLQCIPLLERYVLLAKFYLHEQLALFQLMSKILNLQFNDFLDLVANGFCLPKDLEETEDDSGEKTDKGGMGLGDGQGETDVSERIESEDQLEDAEFSNQKNEKKEDEPDCAEEENGINMSEDFEGKSQNPDKKDEDDESQNETDDVDKQMGETNEDAEELDEKIWGDDEEESETDEPTRDSEEMGKGNQQEESKIGANENGPEEEQNENADERRQEEQKKDINDFDEAEAMEEQVDPYHGNYQPPVEPEPMDLPDDLNIDGDEAKEDKEEGEEENAFDIDNLKNAMPPPQEPEDNAEEKVDKENDCQNDSVADSSDDECDESENKPEDNEVTSEPTVDDNDDHESNEVNNENEDVDKDLGKKEQEERKEGEKEQEEEEEKETSSPSVDTAKSMEAALQVDPEEGCSPNEGGDNVENKEENSKLEITEHYENNHSGKGAGQSQAEEQDSGQIKPSSEENIQASKNDRSKNEKRKRDMGKSDEHHSLADSVVQNKKKQKMMISVEEKKRDDMEVEGEGAEPTEDNDAGMYEHVTKNEASDNYAVDAATEEQAKRQTLNPEDEDMLSEENPTTEVDMHCDDEPETMNEPPEKQQSEKISHDKDSDKSTNKESKKNGDIDKLRNTVNDIEGELISTMNVSRGMESEFFTRHEEIKVDSVPENLGKSRLEIETLLSQWTHVPSTEEAMVAWNAVSSLTDAAARDLAEKLRLVLEPTQASRLRGDYRSGRRINMRKIIPYLASQFRKDKIWLRRTKPSKRNYQIILAIDDSSSMADNHSKELAFETLSLISKAITYLEAGQLSIVSFGQDVNILHPLDEQFSEHSGSRLMQELRFEQKNTLVAKLVNLSLDMFSRQEHCGDNAKLLVLLSDGRGIFSEGREKVNQAVRRAQMENVFLVFIIVDSPLNKDSILDIRLPIFQDGKFMGMQSYMDNFPFPFYMILRDINALPSVLSDALRQWFEMVGKTDV